ncbi:hypothetical protein PU629_07075 [Pullulanibacillus sp. KACC 23026]|uniref:hypothetical protein n=1 Tax=Pullulanibacillus sp. KACC 23026 TaxID=3028315 RepID=UPI0023B1E7A5|nr:hypothetical protein [Pullulanibacillus sp. KACC 23026]WEG14121.1 hypothetical protein PU629_07075 [Pullulanibacillus sp. KACC 23026]
MDNQLWLVKATIDKPALHGIVIEKEVEARWPIEAIEKFKKKETIENICNMVSVQVIKA